MPPKRRKSCAVPSCVTNSNILKQMGVTLRYFSFPKDTKLRDKWLASCNKTLNCLKTSDGICSRHFKTSDYEDGGRSKFANVKPRFLKATATPTLFLEKRPEQLLSTDVVEYHKILAQEILHGHNETSKSGEQPHFVDFSQSESENQCSKRLKLSIETDEIQQSQDEMDFDPFGGEDMTIIDIKEESDFKTKYLVKENEQFVEIIDKNFNGNCYVCDKAIRERNLSQLSREDFMKIIQKVLKDIANDYMIVLSDSDDLCAACCTLVARVAKLEAELRTVSLGLRALLRLKYSLPLLTLETNNNPKNQSELQHSIRKDIRMGLGTGKRSIMTQTTATFFAHKRSKQTQTRCAPKQKKTRTVGLSSLNQTKTTINIVNGADEVELLEGGLYEDDFDDIGGSVEDVDCPENFSNVTELPMNDNYLAKESEVEIGTGRQIEAVERTKQLEERISKTEVGVLKCSRCSFKTKSPEQLETHMSSFTNKDGFYCSICDFAHHRPSLYRLHKACHSETSKNKKCVFCGKAVHDELHMRFHLEAKHKPNPFNHKCPMCDKVFLFNKVMKRHVRIRHTKEFNTFKCEKCGKTFNDVIKHNTHVDFYHREALICKYCKKQFFTVKKLIHHENTVHRLQRTEHQQCRFCRITFVMPDILKRHEQQHTGVYQHRCGTCGIGFHTREALVRHTRSCKLLMRRGTKCTPRNPHHSKVCDVCGKFVKNNYKVHRQMHENPEKSFQCHICGKKFRWSHNMKTHIRNLHPEQAEEIVEAQDLDPEQLEEGTTKAQDQYLDSEQW